MKINWTVRIKNPVWWFQVVMSVVLPIFTYYGLSGTDITSWALLGRTLLDAIGNPYVIITALVALWNAVTDPTTAGIGDSVNALTYTEPKKREIG